MPSFERAFFTNCSLRGFSRSVVQPDSLYSQKIKKKQSGSKMREKVRKKVRSK